jgi:hypothetical protein
MSRTHGEYQQHFIAHSTQKVSGFTLYSRLKKPLWQPLPFFPSHAVL